MSQLKRTPLYELYEKYGGKLIDFGGWEMPLQYSKIVEEHHAVRNEAGLFDVSHMGKIDVTGKDAMAYVQKIFTNDVSKLSDGQAQYGLMCYENGTVVDDLIVYKNHEQHFMLVINAANIEKDLGWLHQHMGAYAVTLTNLTESLAEIAFQGPKAEKILQKYTKEDLSSIKFFHFKTEVDIHGFPYLVSRTGYTGEDGFEIYGSAEAIRGLWSLLLDHEAKEGVLPVGLGARDTLRFEAALPLYGHEISDQITPLEAGLGFAVKLEKDFIGADALRKQKELGIPRKLVGFQLTEKGVAREGYDVYFEEQKIGFVTTGYLSPTLNKAIGLALVDQAYSQMDGALWVTIRNQKKQAKIISKKFLEKKYKK